MSLLTQQNAVLVFLTLTIILANPGGANAGCCCPTYWTGFGQNCYRFFSYNQTTMSAAEQFCQRFSKPSAGYGSTSLNSLGHLVSIHSNEEQNFVATMFETSRKKDNNNGKLWIGLHDTTTEDNFEWTDGSPVDYTRWGNNQPDNWGTGEDCVEIGVLYDNIWNDVSCNYDTRIQYFICKLPMW